MKKYKKYIGIRHGTKDIIIKATPMSYKTFLDGDYISEAEVKKIRNGMKNTAEWLGFTQDEIENRSGFCLKEDHKFTWMEKEYFLYSYRLLTPESGAYEYYIEHGQSISKKVWDSLKSNDLPIIPKPTETKDFYPTNKKFFWIGLIEDMANEIQIFRDRVDSREPENFYEEQFNYNIQKSLDTFENDIQEVLITYLNKNKENYNDRKI